MKKFIILGIILLLILFSVWFLLYRDTTTYKIKKDGEYEIDSKYSVVIVSASNVVIKNSSVNEVVIESSDAEIEIENSTIKFLNVESSEELNLSIDENTLVEYFNVLEADDVFVTGDFAMVNLKSTNSHIYLVSGVIGNVYSYGSDIEIDIEGDIIISNYFLIGASEINATINGQVDYLEIDENSNNNQFDIYGVIELIVNEGTGNTFVIHDGASVASIKTNSDISGLGEVDSVTKSEESIDIDEIIGAFEEVDEVINQRTESIAQFSETHDIEEEVINTFIYETGFEIEKVSEIVDSLEGSSYDIASLLDLAVDSGVTNYQIKEIINYTDNSDLSVVEVVNLFDKLEMDSNDISEALSVTENCGLSVSSVLDMYVVVKNADEVSTDLLLEVKDDYDLSASDIAKLGVHFSGYIS